MEQLQKKITIFLGLFLFALNGYVNANNGIIVDNASMDIYGKTTGSTRIMVIGDINASYGSSTTKKFYNHRTRG